MNLIQNVEGDDLALETCVLITRNVGDDCYAHGRRRVGFDPSCIFKFFFQFQQKGCFLSFE